MAQPKHADPEPPDVSAQISGAAVSSIPSFAAASALLSAPYSCLVVDTQRRHVRLPPACLGRRRSGIRAELQQDLLKFSHTLKGVPLAYDNIRILGQYGDIIDDSGYIHMDVIADFVVFQPRKGQKLLGKVNKLGISHVGCLVHGCFNASIPKPNFVATETWRDAGPRIGTELEFEVTALDADNVGVLLIRGRLDRTRVQELLAMGETSESSVPVDQPNPSDAEANGDLNPDSTDEPAVKKKKKKKKKTKEEAAEEEATDPASVQLDDSAATELNTTVGEEKGTGEKKKKKKKDKHPKQEEEQVQVSAVELPCSDSSGYQSDKSCKKRKREPAADTASSAGEGPEPKKSKKRKNRIEQFA